MSPTRSTFASPVDGTSLATYSWEEIAEPRGVVQIAHGIAEQRSATTGWRRRSSRRATGSTPPTTVVTAEVSPRHPDSVTSVSPDSRP